MPPTKKNKKGNRRGNPAARAAQPRPRPTGTPPTGAIRRHRPVRRSPQLIPGPDRPARPDLQEDISRLIVRPQTVPPGLAASQEDVPRQATCPWG